MCKALASGQKPALRACFQVGANDITNKAACDTPGCPIYGMPVIEVPSLCFPLGPSRAGHLGQGKMAALVAINLKSRTSASAEE